jgi:lipopolysaccharide/colanic/teichoic acid biosynthesis glycosyltransferase
VATVADRLRSSSTRHPDARRRARLTAASRKVAELRWYQSYRRRLLATDAAAVVFSVVVAYVLRWNGIVASRIDRGFSARDAVLAVVVAAAWMGLLAYTKSRDVRILGSGPTEYQRVFGGTWRFFAALAIAAFVFKYYAARGYIAVAAPLGLVSLLATRYAWRQWLHRRRSVGQCVSTVLAIGHRSHVETLIADLNDRLESGYRVVGACVPVLEQADGPEIRGVPVLGDLFSAASVAHSVGVDTVAVTGADALTTDVVRRLGWELEPSGTDLMLTAALADVAGPRITITPADNVALVHVEAPRFAGARYWLKAIVDWLGAAVLTILVSPVLIVTAIAVKVSSRGRILFHQERVGRNGTLFPMYKFRSMRTGAEHELPDLAGLNEGSGPLFKIRDDPRVTRVGRLLRRWSVEADVRRRLLVKPGMTGLWQTSGRSDLTWEQSVRLDVYYVENWTLFGDLMILLRTARAVVRGQGAF